MAGLILQDEACVTLFKPLIEVATNGERDFFTGCQRLDAEARRPHLTAYCATGALFDFTPPQAAKPAVVEASKPVESEADARIRAEILKILSRKAVPFDDLIKALTLLEKLPPCQWDLWTEFYKHIPNIEARIRASASDSTGLDAIS